MILRSCASSGRAARGPLTAASSSRSWPGRAPAAADSSAAAAGDSGDGSRRGSTARTAVDAGGGHDATAGTDSGPADGRRGRRHAAEATRRRRRAFEFDGFVHPDGYSEAVVLPGRRRRRLDRLRRRLQRPRLAHQPVRVRHERPDRPGRHRRHRQRLRRHVDNLITCETRPRRGLRPTARPTTRNASDLCDNPMCPRLVQTRPSGTGRTPRTRSASRGTWARAAAEFNPPTQGRSFMSFLSSGTAGRRHGRAQLRDLPGHRLRRRRTRTRCRCRPRRTRTRAAPGSTKSTVAVHDYTELRMTIKAPINAGRSRSTSRSSARSSRSTSARVTTTRSSPSRRRSSSRTRLRRSRTTRTATASTSTTRSSRTATPATTASPARHVQRRRAPNGHRRC